MQLVIFHYLEENCALCGTSHGIRGAYSRFFSETNATEVSEGHKTAYEGTVVKRSEKRTRVQRNQNY